MSKYPAKITNDIKELAKELKDNYKLTDYESLDLALKAEHNDILKRAFVITSSDDVPTALEAIASSLGYKQ